MVFSSPVFIFLFLPVVLAAYFLLPNRWRNSVLLLASLLFYAWGEPKFTIVMLLSIAFNHICGRMIGSAGGTPRGKRVLILALVVNLSLLGVFKYSGFFSDGVLNPVLVALGFDPVSIGSILLPLGISFFTFHVISYLIDIYRANA